MAQYPFQHFRTLVRAIHELDPAAADWLSTQTPGDCRLDRFQFRGNINGAMVWSRTPQGHGYWSNLSGRLWESDWDHLEDTDGPRYYADGLPIT